MAESVYEELCGAGVVRGPENSPEGGRYLKNHTEDAGYSGNTVYNIIVHEIVRCMGVGWS